MKYLPLSLLVFSGCLAAYDNASPMNGTPDGAVDNGDMATGNVGSGKNMAGKIFFNESQVFPAGISVHIEGFDSPKFTGVTDASGNFKLEIPAAALNLDKYLIMSGMFQSKMMLPTYAAPAFRMDGTFINDKAVLLHGYRNQDDNVGVRGYIEQSLKMHGNIAMNDDFNANYSIMYGRLVTHAAGGGEHQYSNYTLAIVSGGATITPSATCNPKLGCCVFYTYEYVCFKDPARSECKASPTMLLFDAVKAFKNLVVVCPATTGTEITLQQTAPFSQLTDEANQKTADAAWPDISSPIVGPSSGAAVYVDWYNN